MKEKKPLIIVSLWIMSDPLLFRSLYFSFKRICLPILVILFLAINSSTQNLKKEKILINILNC